MSSYHRDYIPNDLTLTKIVISKIEDNEYEGHFYNEYDGAYIKFHSLLQLLKELDNLFDRFTFPEVTHEYRTFSGSKDRKERTDKEYIMNKHDNKNDDSVKNATFLLQVKFRRNASWQGQIQWVDKSMTKTFRSTLELIRLIDNAIEQTGESITWEEPPKDDEQT